MEWVGGTMQGKRELMKHFLETLDVGTHVQRASAAAPSLRFIAFDFSDDRTYWEISPQEDGSLAVSRLRARKAAEIFGA